MEGYKKCIWNRLRTLIKTQTHQREKAFRVKVTGNEIKQRDQTRDFPSGHSIELHETCMVGCLAKVLLNNPTTNSTSVFTFVLHHTHAVCRKGPNIYISLISGLPSFSHTKTTGEEVDNSSRRSSRDQIYNTRQNSSFQTSNTLFPIRIHFNNFWEKNFIKKWTTADDHLLAPTQRIFQPPPLNENSLWLDRIENVGKQKLYNTLFFFPIFLDAKRRFSSSL
jgi:hypothetical protein